MYTFREELQQLGNNGYIYIAIGIVFLLFLIHFYSLSRQKKKLEHTVDAYTKVFQKAFDVSHDALLILSKSYSVIYINQAAITLLGVAKDANDTLLTPMPKIKINHEWETLDKYIENVKKQHKDTHTKSYFKSILKLKGDKEVEVNLFVDTVDMKKMKTGRYTVVAIHDLSPEINYKNMKYTNGLTQLPNEQQLLHDLPVLYSKVHVENNKIGLILLHFDNFTRLRSIIGHEQINQILIKFSKYLTSMVESFNISAYHTIDNHFVLSVSNLASLEDIENFVKKIQRELATFYKMENARLHLTVSVGIAVYPDSGATRQLLDHAYKALYKAESEGDGNLSIYMPATVKSKYNELTLHNDMESALAKREFEVYYQPIIRSNDLTIVAAEALIRWIHPRYGFIPPDVFIGLMEKTGFIIQLGKFILEEVLKQQKRWELFKFKDIEVSINVSMVEIATGDFVENVQKQLQYHKVYPERIKFEITEGMAMMGEKETEKEFRKLKRLGVGISLDDFGTGYSSFTYLKKFPAGTLKIDKSLVDHILVQEEDKRIVHAMIELGHNMGMKIVVEGVETKDMVTLLQSLGCDYMQGYYFSKPLPVFEFQKLLR